MKFGLVAGEASGDALGAGLIRAISSRLPDATFEGIAGPAMIAAGCDRWEDAEALAVMGLIEPLFEIPRLLRLRRTLIRRWRASPPDVFVGIDAPDFNLGLEKRLRSSGIRTAHYVGPTVWAWRAGRIKTVQKAADLVLCIFPFEAAIYDQHNVAAVFVGHPRADSMPSDVDTGMFRRRLGLEQGRLIAVLPGSRRSEVLRLGPLFAEAAARLAATRSDVRFVTPVAAPKLRPLIEDQLRDADIRDAFLLLDGESEQTMAAADVVLLASGTAALESALLAKPTVAAYKVARLTAWVLRRFKLLTLERFTMPNLLTEEALIPEFIQEAATADALAGAVAALLDDPARCTAISSRFATLRDALALGADQRAADAVIALAVEK